MPTWSPQQDDALRAVSEWLKDKNGPQVFRLFGWAGTGKSTLARYLAEGVRSVKYAAFTGKAALVMRKKGCRGASTIHSLIYTLVSEKDGEEVVWRVTDIAEGKAVLDGNHELAGQRLRFEATVVDVRPATQEEISHGHVHGAHGHHH